MQKIIKNISLTLQSNISIFFLSVQAFLIGCFLSIYFIDATVKFLVYHGVHVLPEAVVAAGLAGIIILQVITASESMKNIRVKYAVQYGFIFISLAGLIILKFLTYTKFFIFFYFAGFLPFGMITVNILQMVGTKIKVTDNYLILRINEAILLAGIFTGGLYVLFFNTGSNISAEYILVFILLMIVLLQLGLNKYNIPITESQQDKPIKSLISYFSELPLKYTLLVTGLFISLSAINYAIVDYSFLYTLETIYKSPISLTKFLILFFLITTFLGYVFKVFVYQNLIKTFKFYKAIIFPPVISIIALFCLSIMFFLPNWFNLNSPYSLMFLAIVFTRIFVQLIRESFEYYTLKLNLVAQESLANRRIDSSLLNIFNFWAVFFSGMILLILKSVDINNLQYRVLINLLVAFFWLIIAYALSKRYSLTIKHFVDSLTRGRHNENHKTKDYVTEFEGNNLTFLRYILNYQSYYQPHHFRKLIKQLPDSLKIKLGVTLNKNNFIEELHPEKKLAIKQNTKGLQPSSFFDTSKGFNGHMVESLTESIITEDRMEAVRLITESKNPKYINILKVLIRDTDDEVRRMAISAITKFKSIDLIYEAIEYLTHEDYADLVCDVLMEIGRDAVIPLSLSFNKSSVDLKSQTKIIRTIAQIPSEDSNHFLISKLEYPNKSIVFEATNALKKVGFHPQEKDKPILLKAIDKVIGNCTWLLSMAFALDKGKETSQLLKAIQEEIYFTFDLLFNLLELKYGKQIVQYLKKSRLSGSSNEHREYAIEILDNVVNPEIKSKLFPLLHNNSREEILRQLENQYPISLKTPEAALKEIINIDLGYISKWTKSCAIVALSALEDVSKSEDIVAQLYNPEPLLSEAAVFSIKNWGNAELFDLETRLPERVLPRMLLLADKVELNRFHFLNQKVLFLKNVPYFSKVRGENLLNLAEVIEGQVLPTKESITFKTGTDEILPLFSLPYGEVIVSDGGKNSKKLLTGHLYGLTVYTGTIKIEAVTDSFLYVLRPEYMTSVVLNNEDISDALFSFLKESKIH
jgi:ATP:ADP antiporter, AAA family